MSGKIQNVCQKCGKLEQLKPAGISKKTNRPYDAFYTCVTKDCWKTPNNPVSSVKQQENANNGVSRAEFDALKQRVSDLEDSTKDIPF